jgi:hypothetical protein
MIVVADASVLVAELLRRRGRTLFARSDLGVVVAEEQWNEAEHELPRRIRIMVDQGRLTIEQGKQLQGAVCKCIDDKTIEIVAHETYAAEEIKARRRVPRDARDWPTIALVLDVAIFTGDGDFLGCGCPPWTVTTLRAELDDT